MKHTLIYLLREVNNENIEATETIRKLNLMEILEKEKYLILTDKIIVNETN